MNYSVLRPYASAYGVDPPRFAGECRCFQQSTLYSRVVTMVAGTSRVVVLPQREPLA